MALALRARGFKGVRVLQGGLKGWLRAGYPTEPTDEVEAALN